MISTGNENESESAEMRTSFLRSVSPTSSDEVNSTMLSGDQIFNATSFLDERSLAFVKMFDQALSNLTLINS